MGYKRCLMHFIFYILPWWCDRLYTLNTAGTIFSILHTHWPYDLEAPPTRRRTSLYSLWNWTGPQDSLITNRIWWKWCCMTSEAGPEKAKQCQPWSPGILIYQLLHLRGLFREPSCHAVIIPNHMETLYIGTLVDSPRWAQCRDDPNLATRHVNEGVWLTAAPALPSHLQPTGAF